MESKQVMVNVFDIAANNPRTVITVAGKDMRSLRAWLLDKAIEVYETLLFYDLNIMSYRNEYRQFDFYNGSVIEFRVYQCQQDAKCGKRNILVMDNRIDLAIKQELQLRTQGDIFIID